MDATDPGEPTLAQCVTCPTKFEVNPERDWAKQCYDCFKDDRTRRVCTACNKARILPTEKNIWQKLCGTCYAESPMRSCDGCKKPKIKTVEPWRQLCTDCWPDRHKFLQICEKCKDKPIKKGAPSWVNTCMKCYLTEKGKHFEKCGKCNSPYLTKRKTAPACRHCMILEGKVIFRQPPIAT